MKFQAIEEKKKLPNGDTEIRFVILFPVDDSLEIKKYENSFVLTDTQTITSRNPMETIYLLKSSNAKQVFGEFYKDNFLL